MKNAASNIAAPCEDVVQSAYPDRGFHSGIDRIADDAVGENIFDRTDVELAFKRSMFGDVGQPQLVRPSRGEVSLDEVVMHGWTNVAALASLGLLAELREQAIGRADSPCRPLRHHLARIGSLVRGEPVIEPWVIPVRIKQRVRPIRLDELRVNHRLG